MTIQLSDFVKFYPLRAKGLAWFFGAGSSFSAGVPTAGDFIWDFKRKIYCAEQSLPLNLYKNLGDIGITSQIQNYFDSQSECPPATSPEEYSYYFERAYPSSSDRSRYIIEQTRGMELSFGHKALGVLIKNHYLKLIFTTNFDKAFENVVNQNLSQLENWFCGDLDNAHSALRYFQSGNRPLILKLHGDFFSERIKNTTEELKEQDSILKNILSLSLDTNGLCVMGYSGRDVSIMQVLKEKVLKENTFPNGLYWFIRSGSQPLPDVVDLINTARESGKMANLVEIDTFDSAWSNIIKGFDNLPTKDTDQLSQSYLRGPSSSIPKKGTKYPLIRLNGIPIIKYPATARLYKCDAGDTKTIKVLIEESQLPLIAIRKKAGIVGFGSDENFNKVFGKYGDHELDLYQITEKDIIYDDSVMKGLLTNAISAALVNGKPLRYTKRSNRYIIFIDPKKLSSPILGSLKKTFGTVSDFIPNTKLIWVVGLEINIQYALSTPLLLLAPTLIVSKGMIKAENSLVAPFIKEFTARWYNQKYDEILNSWLEIFFQKNKEVSISTYDNLNGVNAHFKLSRTTTFSRGN